MSDTKLLPCPFCGGEAREVPLLHGCDKCEVWLPPVVWSRRASPWQPIASAPKDGTEIWLFVSKDVQSAGSWDDYFNMWKLHLGTWVADPTHWMPRPQPPK